MGTQVSSKLCTLIEARVAEFNHVIKLSHTQCVPTALRMLLQSRRSTRFLRGTARETFNDPFAS